MKRYFDFTLTGKKFLPIWLAVYISLIALYAINGLLKDQLPLEDPNIELIMGFSFLALIISLFILCFYFYIVKITIENVKYQDTQLRFNGEFPTYLGKILAGIILSVITLFIYTAWFIRDIVKFIINHSFVDTESFEFKGKGSRLFLILLLTSFIPIILLAVVMKLVMGIDMTTVNENYSYRLIYQGVALIIMIPYMYLAYKWMVDIKFKGYHIKWRTGFFESCLKILAEILLTMITFGIYMPLAYLKLYKYFAERTIAEKSDVSLKFGYELESGSDFLYLWGQCLLTIVTLGIYYPWAYSKIGKRILAKTYVTEFNVT